MYIIRQLKHFLQSFLPIMFINRLRVIRFPYTSFLDTFAKDALATFLCQEEQKNSKLVRELKKDIYKCTLNFQTSASEYFLFGFRGKPEDYRATFLSDCFREEMLSQSCSEDVKKQLDDKSLFYTINKRYFCRKAVLVPACGFECGGG